MYDTLDIKTGAIYGDVIMLNAHETYNKVVKLKDEAENMCAGVDNEPEPENSIAS
jgi:tetrahydromethanopterin S-methyltransferase subunit B